MPKNQVGAFVFMVTLPGLLSFLFTYFSLLLLFYLWFVCNVPFFLSFFFIDRNYLVKTLWINSNLKFILEPRWFKKTFKLSPTIPWVKTLGLSLIQWLANNSKYKAKACSLIKKNINQRLKEENKMDF